MALPKNIFTRTFPQPNNELGDTVNLWVSSSQTGSGNYYQKWVAKGITIPIFGSNGNLSQVLEQVDRVGFKYRNHIDGLTRIDIVEDPQAETSAANSCGKSRIQIDQEAWWDSPYPHYASYVYDDDEGTGPFQGDGRWWFIPTGSALGGYSFKIDNSGKILAYCTCSSAGDGYPEMREPGSKEYFIVDIGERLAYPSHYFLQFKEEVPIPKGPTAGAFDSSSGIESVVLYPGITENFFNSDYNATANNNEDNRSSQIYLRVDKLGADAQPSNISYITDNQVDDIRYNLPEDVFANIQDSNYETTGWNRVRYEGSKAVKSEGDLPPAISLFQFSGSVYSLAATSESIANEDSFESRNIQTFYIYGEYDPGSTFINISPTGGDRYIRVIDEFSQSIANTFGCTEDTIQRKTKAIMIDGSGNVTTNDSTGDLVVTVKYNTTHAFGSGQLNVPITILTGSKSGSYGYNASYQTIPFGSTTCTDITQLYGSPDRTAVLGDNDKTYRIVDATFTPPSETSDIESGTNFILKNRPKGTALDVVQSAKVLDIRKRKIYETNSNGIVVGSKNL